MGASGSGVAVERSEQSVQVVVAGAGPAGLALAACLAERGLETLVVAPGGQRAWTNRYAAWADELEGVVSAGSIARRWPSPLTRSRAGATWRALDRSYVLLDNDALQRELVGRIDRAGGRIEDGAVARIEAGDGGRRAALVDGRSIRCALLVDASGARTRLTDREPAPAPAWQTAWGVEARVERGAERLDAMRLMDWSPARTGDDPPSFLYAMPLGQGRVFVEETALAARPAVPIAVLRARLRARLAREKIRLGPAIETERCAIPMGLGLPVRASTHVAWGAAASLIHPATGYQVARALTNASQIAEAIASAISSGLGPDEIADRAWGSIWPAPSRRRRRLYDYGLEALLAMSPDQARAFFEGFFALPTPLWSSYLSDTFDSEAKLARAMWSMFRAASPGVRARLAGPILARPGRALARGLWRDAARGRGAA